ncbi:hypothetical protein A0H81_02007 [Grifola frondosa]|uniref:Transcription factor domain-containing protein n=1 Tax=Grifola frondosa TaxID=5627 RepID=A0A1C7MNJ3_GRIFR|nr:hypothetical protein A0H81_02007 [Grifola frondosa]
MDGSSTTNTFLSTHEEFALIQTFLKYASQVGFFMNISRFLSAVSNGESSAGGIGDALVQAVYLWGSHLSVSDVSRARAPSFLSRSLQEVSKSVPSIVTETSDYRVVQTIQAEVLLSNYFFTTGRFLEGRYHSLAAVALVTGSRLHQLGSNMDPIMETTGNMESVTFGENVCAFWTVYTLDNCWL